MRTACITAACLLAAGLSANARSAEPFSFEPTPRVLEKGRDPQLAVRESGELFLLRVDGGTLWLQTSDDSGDSFGEAIRVNDIAPIYSHAESTPQMVVRSMHEFYCLWEAKDSKGHTGLRLSRSMNWGKSFSKSIAVDPASTAGQGFYSMTVAPDGTIFVAWLDGRDKGKGKPDTSAVYIARSTDHGQSFQKSRRVALDACPCCRPALAIGTQGDVYVSWRGVFPNDVRDMLVAASHDGGLSFTAGSRVAKDDWRLNGCPHAGDAMIVVHGRLFVCWHTVRDGQRWLSLAWSDDRGLHFSHPRDVANGVLDANHPRFVRLGQTVGLVFQGRPAAGDAGWGKQNVYFRQMTASGTLLPLCVLGHASGSAMYPAPVYESPNHLFVAWTERSDTESHVVLTRGRLMPERPASGTSDAH